MNIERPFQCAFCKKPSTYVPENDDEPTPDNMICDKCFEEERAAQDRDEKIADYYNEQHRLRYKDIHIFDNDVDRISVTYKRKVLCAWDYSGEDSNFFGTGRRDVMLTAKGYVEGWCDAIDALKKTGIARGG